MLLLLLMANIPVDVEIDVLGKEEAMPTLLDISSFLYDLNLGYELSRLATDPSYEHVHFSRYSLFRNGRPLRKQDRLRVKHLSHSSPIQLQTLVWGAPLAIGAVWGLVQIVEKVSNWKLNRRKLEAEIHKLERESLKAADERQHKRPTPDSSSQPVPIYSEEEFLLQIQHREAAHLINGVTKRLEKAEVRIAEMQIRFVRRTGRTPNDE
jgi:hypothetical protein